MHRSDQALRGPLHGQGEHQREVSRDARAGQRRDVRDHGRHARVCEDPVYAGARVHPLSVEGALRGTPSARGKGGVHVHEPLCQQVPRTTGGAEPSSPRGKWKFPPTTNGAFPSRAAYWSTESHSSALSSGSPGTP